MTHTLSPKVVASTISAAAVVLVCWLASLAGVDVPVEAQGALVVVFTFVAGYLKVDPDRAA